MANYLKSKRIYELIYAHRIVHYSLLKDVSAQRQWSNAISAVKKYGDAKAKSLAKKIPSLGFGAKNKEDMQELSRHLSFLIDKLASKRKK